ncbi:ATP-binding response regulator [Methyloversatilis thermotolerans]|uniref:ATP-binding response regulator n=1 Tax=Methyloversatilis thermotolerans TaxID=1346290 RepID=UPI000367589E|nr:hybrid sensor histidine kinase/response regulator [Methyloversatilis thermotolerans]
MRASAVPDARLLAEQVDLLYRHAPSIYAGNAFAATGLAIMLWSSVDQARLLGWLTALALLTLLRALLVAARRRRPDACDSLRWAHLFATGAAASGCLWGLMGWMFSAPEPLQMASTGIVLAGLVSASVSSLSVHYPAYAVFALPAILPIVARCLQSADGFMRGFALIATGFLVICLIFAWLNNRSIRAAILLRFENLDLLREVSAQREQATAAREQAEQANLAKTRFLAAASHDLRQPLQSLSLFIDAQAQDADADRMHAINRRMREAADAMGKLLDELLDYARIESGSLTPTLAPLALQASFDRLAREFQPIAEAAGLRLRFRPTRCWVHTDQALFEQILRNLVGNALRYTGQGGVMVACRRRGGRLRVEVRDSGVGIPADRLDDVFREFYQLGNPERDRRKGLGLGLSIVDGLARALDHPVSVRSQPGRGSVFALSMPPAQAQASAARHRVAAPSMRLAGHSVLLIDNEPDIREALAALMRPWGVVVHTAESAADALASLPCRPDCVLADFRLLDGHTGIDAIAALRDRFGADLPAALITGDTDPARIRDARAAGFALLQKPTPAHRLLALLEFLLQPPESAPPRAA